MRIIGVDPGTTETAWCEFDNGNAIAVEKQSNETVLDHLRRSWNPKTATVALEMVQSFGMPVGREIFETVLWIGRFMEAWESRGGTVRLIYRREVKLHLCYSAKAKDANVRQALIDKFGPGKERAIGKKKAPGPLYGFSGDHWSALAVAVTAAETATPL